LAPAIQTVGPALLQEALYALDYSESAVAKWLAARMFAGQADAQARGKSTAAHFNDASSHKGHGRRINRDEARANGVVIEDLEATQNLQDAVLTA